MPASRPRLSRRQLLSLMGASAAAVVVPGCSNTDDPRLLPRDANGRPVQPRIEGQAFRHGVASGEPLPDAVVIWTRVTPQPDALPGSGLGTATPVRWEVASDAAFNAIIASGEVLTDSRRDHTVHVDVSGLGSARDYWYRFSAGGQTSPVGRTRTAPAAGSRPDSVRLGMVTCAEWEFGFFGAYRLLAERDDIDAVIHMGDYIYEFGDSYGPIATPGKDFGRVHEPTHDIVSLRDYRTRYGQYRSDPDLQALHARHPFITIYDDHEVANDWWKEGAENHDASQGDFMDRLVAALQAWREWQPLRVFAPDDPMRAWRRMQFGDLVDLFLVDTRLYRDEQPANAIVGYGSVDPAVDDPNRTMLGSLQKQWLVNGLQTSRATWQVVGNQIPFYPFVLATALPSPLEALLQPLQTVTPPLPATLTVEDWNGYRAEQRELTAAMALARNPVVLTGDYHESFAAEIPVRPGDYRLDGNSVGVEFICPSVTSPGLSETLGRLGLPAASLIDTVFEANLQLGNPWVKYHEGFSNGYAVIEFNRERTQMDYWFVADRTDPATTARLAASWQVLAGQRRLLPAPAGLSARARG